MIISLEKRDFLTFPDLEPLPVNLLVITINSY